MKRFFTFLLIVIACITASAERITEQQALQKAQQFMQGKSFTMSQKARNLKAAPQKSDVFYVFNVEDNGGFVIVSGDDRMPEILGYSEKGNLDVETVPCNVRWLLDSYEQAANSLSQSDAKVSRRTQKSSRKAISPLVLTEWGQSQPYNDMCPNAEGDNCLTGCVATAMAQVINYNRWPQDKTGAVDAYVTETLHISMPQLAPTRFNWDNMTPNEIARLMLYCGQSVKMDYGPISSGASPTMEPIALTKVFGYSQTARYVERANYSDAEWDDLIYDDLANHRAVIYNGFDASGGHTFIVHGYKDGKYYVNWGWEGNFDGYFDLSVLAPGNGPNFSGGQAAVVGIQPPAGAADINRPKAVVQEMTVSKKTLNRNTASDDFPSVTISSTVVSDLTGNATIQIGLGLYDADGLRQILASEEHVLKYNESYTYKAEVVIPGTLPQGEYTIKAVNRMQDDEEWLSDAASSDRYVSLTIDDEKASLQAYPKTGEEKYYTKEYGTHTIDGVTYRLVCERDDYHAYVLPFNETEKYAGDVYVPDEVMYANMPFKVFILSSAYPVKAFRDCPELTSLSIGVGATVENCPKLTKLEIRQNVTSWRSISNCNALESVTYPPNLTALDAPSFCEKLKSITYATTRQSRFESHIYWDSDWMPSLTDVYFNSDYPPKYDSEIKPNPNVTIHIPQGTLSCYQNSVFGKWNLVEDQPAIPGSVIWDYCGNDVSPSGIIGVGRGDNDVEFAMCVPASHLTAYKGCKVTRIEFHSFPLTVYDNHYGDVEYVFLTKPGTDYLVKVPLTTVRGTWNTVELPEPYIITGDQLFVGYGRNKVLEAELANESVVDEAFYLRVMGSDYSWGMENEVGIWQKHASKNDGWNNPLPIRFYIEGEKLPTDVVIGGSELVDSTEGQDAPTYASAQSVQQAKATHSGYFTFSSNDKGQFFTAANGASGTTPAKAKAVLKKAPNGKMQLKTMVRSRTPETIKSLKIDWSIDGTGSGSQTFETSLLPNHEETFLIDLPSSIQGRNHSIMVDVAEIDGKPDAIKANSCDTIPFAMPASTHFARRIVMEEATGSWCGWCVRGIETIKRAVEQYPDNFIAIGIHTGDEMYPENRSYDNILNQFSSVPNSLINRTEMFDPGWRVVNDAIERLKDSADADIKATAFFAAADSSRVEINTETVFGYTDNGTTEHRIAYVVLEDNVGPYIQSNYYSDPSADDDPNDYMNYWIHQDARVQICYNDVARGIFDNYQGVKGSVPASVTEGETYSNDYMIDLPDNIQNKQNIRIVVLLIDGTTGEILNAAQTKIVYDQAIIDVLGIREVMADHPADIYTLTGNKVRSKATTLNGLPKGVYIFNGKKVVVK